MGRFTEALKAEIASYDDTEWSGKLGDVEVVIFSKPLTPQDTFKIRNKHPNFMHAPTLDGMVDVIINKARDDQDQPAFDKNDRVFLMRVGAEKIGEIFGKLFGDQLDEYTEEDLEADIKN